MHTITDNHFDDLAPMWWEPEGPCKPLHALNPVRLQFIESHTDLSGKKILDIGCGGGLLTEAMAKKGAHVTGIDISENLIDIAHTHAMSQKLTITYLQDTIESYQEKNNEQFDIITCMELLEHVDDPLSILRSCKKILKPQGHLFLSTVNRTLKSYLLAIIGAEYILQLLPKHTHSYQKFIKPSELMTWLEHTGYRLQSVRGIHYNPFSNIASFQQDLSINYIVHAIPE